MYTREMILRKGAIAAHAGEKVLIPINMRDGSVLGGAGEIPSGITLPRTAREELCREPRPGTTRRGERKSKAPRKERIDKHTIQQL